MINCLKWYTNLVVCETLIYYFLLHTKSLLNKSSNRNSSKVVLVSEAFNVGSLNVNSVDTRIYDDWLLSRFIKAKVAFYLVSSFLHFKLSKKIILAQVFLIFLFKKLKNTVNNIMKNIENIFIWKLCLTYNNSGNIFKNVKHSLLFLATHINSNHLAPL